LLESFTPISFASMNWQQVCEDKNLADLPYKIELNRHGQILMSPARSKHSIFQGRIQRHLNALMKGGEAFPECALDTSDGTKVPDVVWASEAKLQKHFDLASWPEAPEICVEVLSTPTPTKRWPLNSGSTSSVAQSRSGCAANRDK
jgi:Uma2 family endonuclease